MIYLVDPFPYMVTVNGSNYILLYDIDTKNKNYVIIIITGKKGENYL